MPSRKHFSTSIKPSRTFHVECDVSSINRRRVPYHTRLKSNFEPLTVYHICNNTDTYSLFSLYKRGAFKKKKFWTKVGKKFNKKKFGKKCWNRNYGKKILKKKFWNKNFEKKIWKKLWNKNFGKKIRKTKCWKKNVEKKCWKKVLTTKFWKNNLKKKNIHNQHL